MSTTYIDEIQDPVTGEVLVFEATTELELEELVAEHFSIAEAEALDLPVARDN